MMLLSLDITAFDTAQRKARDPKMTLQGNPLAREKADPYKGIEEYNMDRLSRDARLRSCPVRGAAYSAIMDTRYKED
uniref:Uncharacterized protein n=1 Tax=Podoviridae sp. ct2iq11 TaxID=2827720 RepID=A0A8S5TPN1_9CAUD|nr:MAG TPA: hypothetical protein [Podoviridae sp. ct2iq11]